MESGAVVYVTRYCFVYGQVVRPFTAVYVTRYCSYVCDQALLCMGPGTAVYM